MGETQTFKGKTYKNGEVPAVLLAPVKGTPGAFLRVDAADAWGRAYDEVLAVTGIRLTVRGWMRTKAEQVTFYTQRHRKAKPGERVCCYWDGVPYVFTGVGHASPPGKSNHGWGLAVDVDDFGGVGNFNHPRRVKTIATLKKHGWTDTEGRGSIQEPWHLVYNPASDRAKSAAKGSGEGFLVSLSDRDQDAVLWNARETKAAVDEVRSLLKAKIKDGNGAAVPRDIWERHLDVSRRTLAAVERLTEVIAGKETGGER